MPSAWRARRIFLSPRKVLIGLSLLILFAGHCPAATGAPADGGRIRALVQRSALAAVLAAVSLGIYAARRGRALAIRQIPGLLALQQAVARAADARRPSLFTVGGAGDVTRVQSFAAMPLLRLVARLSGKHRNRLLVPVCYPAMLPVHTQAIRAGLAEAGAPDHEAACEIRFFPGGQFFFAMAATGWMLEEKPAACFYFGWWEADSLLFAETGQTIHALQIAGTDQLTQIAFFIAACDHTVIGEEFWAASAQLSRDPHLLGSLGAQDLIKLALLSVILAGILLCFHPDFANWIAAIREIFVSRGAAGA
jgi:hypothetical protein